MTDSCVACATPLGARDRACPVCGATVARAPGVAAPHGRQILINAGGDAPLAAPARTPPTPPPSPSSPRTAAPPVGAGPVASGTVTGDVTETEIAAVGRPQRVQAAAAAALAVLSVLALLFFGGGHRGAGLALLLPTLVGTAVFAAAPFLAPRRRSRSVVTRFTVTAVSGAVTACELLGRPTAAPLRVGDPVEVYGRGTPVRVAEVVRGEERFRGRLPAAFLVARHAPTAALALALVCAVIACALVVSA